MQEAVLRRRARHDRVLFNRWRLRNDELPWDDDKCGYNSHCPLRRHELGPYCVYHSRGFEVRMSTIEGAGRGLFTTRPLYAGDVTGVYRGEYLDLLEFERRYRHQHATYVWQAGTDDVFVDARTEHACLERYINDGTLGHCNNLEAEVEGSRVVFRALRHIRPGEELFYSYGDEYWK